MSLGESDYAQHARQRVRRSQRILYKYVTANVAQLILQNKTLRFQSPLLYNDPFDSQWDVLWPLITPEAKAQEREILREALLRPESWPADGDVSLKRAMNRERARVLGLPKSLQESEIESLIAQCNSENDESTAYHARITDIRHRMRVLCMSENVDSILMWSHYAEQHKGAVIGFDAYQLESYWKRPLEPINYCEKLPSLIDPAEWNRAIVYGTQLPSIAGEPREWALTKHTDWKYEREWRFIWITETSDGEMFEYMEFPASAVAEIILGARMITTKAESVIRSVEQLDSSIAIFRMAQHSSRFELVRESLGSGMV